MRLNRFFLGAGLLCLSWLALAEESPTRRHTEPARKAPRVAQTPPMGWNSWDCYGASVREDEVRANADYMAAHLKKFGWEYVVVDIQWYEPTADSDNYHPNAKLEMDGYGRLIPATNRFPSARGGKGFKPLADYVHSKGLKFGIHLLRGIPRQAAQAHTPILGTNLTADDVANRDDVCPWNTDMVGVDTTRPGAQAWYDSLLKLYASWDVDYIKVDDLSQPYHAGEIEAIAHAIAHCGRPIVFSTSPGETPLSSAEHIQANANLWRVSADFWDHWPQLRHAFDLSEAWYHYVGPGHWPDEDMLPLGHLGIRSVDGDRHTRFAPDEQVTLMTLWCICRSPLMFGGNLPDNDAFTLALLTNPEVLTVLKRSRDNHPLFRRDDKIVWLAEGERGSRYVALFNLADQPRSLVVLMPELNLTGRWKVRDCWKRADLGFVDSQLSADVPAHGARLLKLTPPSPLP